MKVRKQFLKLHVQMGLLFTQNMQRMEPVALWVIKQKVLHMWSWEARFSRCVLFYDCTICAECICVCTCASSSVFSVVLLFLKNRGASGEESNVWTFTSCRVDKVITDGIHHKNHIQKYKMHLKLNQTLHWIKLLNKCWYQKKPEWIIPTM